MSSSQWPLNRPILRLNSYDTLLLADLCESILIVGGIGSGKTSGSGETLMAALLAAGAGFLCLSAKPDEYARIEELCRLTGRLDDLIYFAPESEWACDVLDYALRGPGASIEAAAQLIDTLVEAESRNRSGSGSDPFWRDFGGMISRQAVTGVCLGQRQASLKDVHRFILSAPQQPDDVLSEDWANRSFCAKCLADAKSQLRTPDEEHALRQCADFWLSEWPRLADKTRTSGQIVVTTALSKFLTGPLYHLMSSGKTNLPPEVILDGKIVVMGMPTSIYHGPGRFFQIAYKTLFQRCALARSVHDNPRPVVLWQDEVQNFLTPGLDMLFQTMGRQSRLITVSLGHSLPVFYTAMGGTEAAKHEVDGWVANHMVKVLHANSCHITNEFFSNLFGQQKQLLSNSNVTFADYDLFDDLMNAPSQNHVSSGWSENWQPLVQPVEFTRLPKGGVSNGFRVEAYLHAGGRQFANGHTHLRVTFQQRR